MAARGTASEVVHELDCTSAVRTRPERKEVPRFLKKTVFKYLSTSLFEILVMLSTIYFKEIRRTRMAIINITKGNFLSGD